jgi:hypothetical protein
MFEQGKGVSLDYISAYTWYSAAAASGMHKSADRMKSLEQVMLPEQIRIAKSRALAWKTEHVDTRETSSEQNLGSFSLLPEEKR